MTVDGLQSFTRQRLAEMAHDRHLAGWHQMRKADLIRALTANEQNATAVASNTAVMPDDGKVRTRRKGRRRSTRRRTSPLHRMSVNHRGRNDLDVQPLSPYWLSARWTLAAASRDRLCAALGPYHHHAVPVLRLYDVTGDDAHVRDWVCDVPPIPEASEWCVRVPSPGHSYQLEFGVLDAEEGFHRLLTGPRVTMPLCILQSSARDDVPSPLDERPDHAAPLLSTGRADRSWPLVQRSGTQHPDESAGLEHHDLIDRLQTDVVLQGRVNEDATVDVLGQPVEVAPGGVFELRMPLPEGRDVVPIVVTAADGRARQTLVLAIERNTKLLGPQHPHEM